MKNKLKYFLLLWQIIYGACWCVVFYTFVLFIETVEMFIDLYFISGFYSDFHEQRLLNMSFGLFAGYFMKKDYCISGFMLAGMLCFGGIFECNLYSLFVCAAYFWVNVILDKPNPFDKNFRKFF